MSQKSIFNIPSKNVHFVGIGGIGVSSLAYWFKSQKWAVSGSDSAEGLITLGLKKDGFKVKIGHKKGLLGPKTGLVIYSNAIKADNPELIKARHLGIPTMSYPEAVGVLTRHYKTFGVAGAHGKSTTTALLSLVLMKAGWDPTIIIGTKLKELNNKNFRSGKSDNLILEADEFGGAFWNYSPFGAIITNIDREHLDFYGDLANIKKSFLRFIGNIQTGGILVANRDDKNLFALKREIEKITKRNGVKVVWYSLPLIPNSLFKLLKNNLSIPGQHNVSNALAVYVLAKNLGIPENKILSALKSYHGAWRRMEYRGELRIANNELRMTRYTPVIQNSRFKIPIYDDYAHHPTEIKATLQAFKEKYSRPVSGRGSPQQSGAAKIICVFQPHQAKRLKALFNDFAHAFKDADSLILLPSYKVTGRDIPMNKKYTSESLAKKIKGAIYLKTPNNLQETIKQILVKKFQVSSSKLREQQAVLVMMGAGSIVEYTDKLIGK